MIFNSLVLIILHRMTCIQNVTYPSPANHALNTLDLRNKLYCHVINSKPANLKHLEHLAIAKL